MFGDFRSVLYSIVRWYPDAVGDAGLVEYFVIGISFCLRV